MFEDLRGAEAKECIMDWDNMHYSKFCEKYNLHDYVCVKMIDDAVKYLKRSNGD